MEKQYICFQVEGGKPDYREATPEELAAMQPEPITWHINKPFRVSVANDTWRDWFTKKRDHSDYFELTGKLLYPDLMALLDVVRIIPNEQIVNDNANTYVYLAEVFEAHRPIIAKYGATVEPKPEK